MMEANGLIFTLVIGAVAGWLAGKIMKGRGFGILGNIVVGVVGAVLGVSVRVAWYFRRWNGGFTGHRNRWRHCIALDRQPGQEIN